MLPVGEPRAALESRFVPPSSIQSRISSSLSAHHLTEPSWSGDLCLGTTRIGDAPDSLGAVAGEAAIRFRETSSALGGGEMRAGHEECNRDARGQCDENGDEEEA